MEVNGQGSYELWYEFLASSSMILVKQNYSYATYFIIGKKTNGFSKDNEDDCVLGMTKLIYQTWNSTIDKTV